MPVLTRPFPMLQSSAQPRFKLFTVLGVPVFANYGVFFLIAFILLFYGRGGPAAIFASLGIALIALVSLVAHELGHALAVRKLGYGASKIVLGGLGGVCIWRGQSSARHRILIALAGPAVSLLLAGLALATTLGLRTMATLPGPINFLLYATVFLNLVWGIFNLLPVYPMDGGQALRSAFSLRQPAQVALKRSLIVSMTVAGLGALAGFVYGEMIITILLGWMLVQNWNSYKQAFP